MLRESQPPQAANAPDAGRAPALNPRAFDRNGYSWLDMAMKRIGVAEAKDQLSKYLRLAESGDEVEVTDRGRPIARIVPATPISPPSVRRARTPFVSVRSRRYPTASWRRSSTNVLLDERQGR
jgi:prevent-host-death family protein